MYIIDTYKPFFNNDYGTKQQTYLISIKIIQSKISFVIELCNAMYGSLFRIQTILLISELYVEIVFCACCVFIGDSFKV